MLCQDTSGLLPDEAEMEELATFWVTLIQNTGNKIRKKEVEFSNLWFTRTKHCLAHFSLDTPFLMFLKLIKTTVFLTPAALLCIIIGHIFFNQCWAIVTECLHIDEDGLPEFNLQRAVDIAHAARGAKKNENKCDEGDVKDDDKDDEAEDDTHEDIPSAGKASMTQTKQLLRRLLSISRKMSFPSDITWPPAVEMDCDFAGKGYSRSLYGSVAKRLGDLESGFPQVPGKGKMKLPYVPRLMLYLVYYSKICQAARLMKHWQDVTKY